MLTQGIEFLASQEIITKYAFNWLPFWIVFGIIFGTTLTLGIVSVINDECEWPVIPALGTVGLIFGLFFGAAIGDELAKPIEYTTEYKVIVEDNVSLAEFYECYEVVGQEGKIFTVRERTE